MKAVPGLYRYGSQRLAGEGLRIGVARHLPRGVRREDWQKGNYFDLRLPLLAPTARVLKDYLGGKIVWKVFARRYLTEMKSADSRHVIDMLAGFSTLTAFSLGCFCEDETHCHHSLLQKLIADARVKKQRVMAAP